MAQLVGHIRIEPAMKPTTDIQEGNEFEVRTPRLEPEQYCGQVFMKQRLQLELRASYSFGESCSVLQQFGSLLHQPFSICTMNRRQELITCSKVAAMIATVLACLIGLIL
ncbi:hypothetical protein [Hyalangium sp.]|uniref:hypothetical protein n=1 Tax=Hyalangium sp. TaxID=2028555 RepID=UPI002D4258EF|nr:hypothetical protein [Hyalangium sp.]HYI02838.1 hypothetical protein [Hyalangium sp.]